MHSTSVHFYLTMKKNNYILGFFFTALMESGRPHQLEIGIVHVWVSVNSVGDWTGKCEPHNAGSVTGAIINSTSLSQQYGRENETWVQRNKGLTRNTNDDKDRVENILYLVDYRQLHAHRQSTFPACAVTGRLLLKLAAYSPDTSHQGKLIGISVSQLNKQS